jgi:DNA polymerase III subunit gamma/tau
MSKNPSTQVPYQGLSRTYRPQLFSNVMGQDAIITTLKNAIRLEKTAQAYLFCGTRGTGKTTLARVLAKALNCHNLTEEFEPCNECESCVEISQGKSLNVFEIDGASHRGIDDIRQLNETVVYAPSSSGCKIFIIDEAHMLTKEAFNALLKTLEEPPPNVKFFLATTEPHKIPATILSRCQRFDLQRISSAQIVQKLVQIAKDQSITYQDEALYRLAALSDGSMRVAESLLDQILCFAKGELTEELIATSLSILPTDPFFEFDEAFEKQDLAFGFKWASTIFSSGKDLSYFLDCLLDHYRNILALQLNLPTPELHTSAQEKYKKSAKIYSQEQALYILDYLIKWHQQSSKTPFKRVSLEMILLHILKSKHRVSAADLICRIEEMQKAVPANTQLESSPTLKPAHLEPIKNTPPREEIKQPKPPVLEEPLPPPAKKVQDEWVELDLIPPPDAPAPAPVMPKEPTQFIEPRKAIDTNTQAKYDTLMRFASVELEGLLTKES